ncbi:MAG: nucleoside phosphorylase [Prolixibacteraceae bacterium]|nr:nucleoside phosphorylase [Prolixibacteraceae bacterium]MBT6763657.1 nucleoside phosphorylase [Prolixibacteraceae bacterium]MBT7000076.1 nucleoside phosphorylase [Prolixibacteraceae bacterium]MBT7396722.1 nucleoside phosphorylase [Prolixibacteraceae bacterium]
MIKHSELILNNDGSIFHLHLKPENISDQIILVGDPARVDIITSFFEKIDFSIQNREFKTVTGWYNRKKLSVISTGIGTDNIDIVLNELDALVNIDLKKREILKKHKSLNIVRIGTSGGLQPDLPVNSLVVSQKSIGFDGMLNFYANRENVCDLSFEIAFKKFTSWDKSLPTPYVVDASEYLLSKFGDREFKKGATISAPGFYGPQGRELRLPLAVPELNQLLEEFSFNEIKITNFEMESSAIYGLSKMLGHKALTICLIIANRVTLNANQDYRDEMKKLIKKVLSRLST